MDELEWRMYECYWSHVANDIEMTGKNCRECAGNKPAEKKRRPLQLFTAGGPLEFVAMYLLGRFLQTLDCNQFVLVMRGRYTK